MSATRWFAIRQELSARRQLLLSVLSFLLPVAAWCLVSYVPFIWHPKVLITEPGGVSYFAQDMLVDGAYVAFMWNNVNSYLVQPWVQGLVTTSMDSGWAGDNDPLSITVEPH